jgi:hypothetical protein
MQRFDAADTRSLIEAKLISSEDGLRMVTYANRTRMKVSFDSFFYDPNLDSKYPNALPNIT